MYEIGMAFGAIQNYAELMEAQIERMTEENLASIETSPPKSEEESAYLWDMHQLIFKETLPRNLRYSCIVLLLTTIETTLLQVCRWLGAARQLRLAVGELRDRPPVGMLTYISKVGGVALPVHPFRSRLAHLVTVRHCIAHAAGSVEIATNPKPIREATRQLEGFSLSEEGYIAIDKGVCGRLIRDADSWEHVIVEAVERALQGKQSK